MKFSEMPYERPDMSALKEQFTALTERLQNAPDYAAARAAFLEEQVLNKHVDTLFTLASVRHTIDTRDKFYDEEMEFANSAMPQIQQWQDSWTAAMLASPYRKNFAEEYGDLMFVNAEIERKAFSPDIMEELQQENELTQQYGKLLASAQIPFEGGVYTLSQLSPFKNDPDDARRLAAWKELLGIYMPWMKLDGEIPFYSEGEGWQRQKHIYESPFYYIDYCLAQTVSLQFWAMLQKDRANAWEHYMAYTRQGGSRVFTELLKNAGLDSPFEESCLRGVCETAKQWLDSYDLTGIE